MPRTALITDIHGETVRLAAVLKDIRARSCRRIICLGDTADERPGSAAAISALLERHIPSVMGNCDQLCDLPPGSPEQAFVDSLPRFITEGDVVLTHIAPTVHSRGLRTVRDAAQVFSGSRQRICFTGHIHIPATFCDGPDQPAEVPVVYGAFVRFEPGRRYAVCVGPVGHGRDGVSSPRYAIWDSEADGVEHVRVGPAH